MDGKGGAKELTWEEVVQWKSEQGPMWLHFDYTNTKAAEWISNKSGLDEVSA
jgi:zinc transporter